MTAPIRQPITIYQPVDPNSTAPLPSKDIDKNAFLKLLVTQLEHQDPLDPSSPEEFASQLAQFSSLEQLTNLNNLLTAQATSQAQSTLTTTTSLGASLIGREVLASDDQVAVDGNGKASVTVDVGGSGGAGALTILDDKGNTVASKSIGAVGGGRQHLDVDLGDLAKGTYHYELTVVDSTGASQTVTSYSGGTVDSVSFDNGSIVLHAGGLSLTLDQLAEIGGVPAGTAVAAAAQLNSR